MNQPLCSQDKHVSPPGKKSARRCDTARANIVFLRFAYIGTLAQLSPAQVREFWSEHSGLLDIYNDEQVMYETLWRGDSWIDLAAVFDAIVALETFLNQKNIELREFVYKTVTDTTGGSLIPPRTALLWCKPLFSRLCCPQGSYEMLFDVFECMARNVSTRLVNRPIAQRNDGKKRTTVMLLMKTRGGGSSRGARQAVPLKPFDCEAWVAKPSQVAPIVFGLPCFNNASVIGDVRSFETLLAGHSFIARSGRLYIDDSPYGSIETFHDFCNRNDYNIKEYKIPDVPVVVMNRDFVCPRSKRVILSRNCCYGAPVYLYSLTHSTTRRPKNLLSALIDAAFAEQECAQLKKIERIHLGALGRISGGLEFTYTGRTESLAVNGIHLVKSTPAKILRKIVQFYVQKGQTTFSYRDFVNDQSIILDPNKPNLTVRMNRLIKSLGKACPRVVIRKKGKGVFEFDCDGKVNYREQ